MTREHWNHWLKFARDEKKKRNTNSFVISTRPPPPPLSAPAPSSPLRSLEREDSQFMDATHAAVQTAFEYQTNETIRKVESSSKKHQRYPTPQSPSLAMPDVGSSRPRGHAKVTTPANSPPQVQPTATISSLSHSSSMASGIPPFQLTSAPSSGHPVSLSARTSRSQPTLGESVIPRRSTIPSPPSFTHPTVNDPSRSAPLSPQSYAHVAPQAPRSPPDHQQVKPTTTASFRITHRMSAPAERISQPGSHFVTATHSNDRKPKPSPSLWNPERSQHSLFPSLRHSPQETNKSSTLINHNRKMFS